MQKCPTQIPKTVKKSENIDKNAIKNTAAQILEITTTLLLADIWNWWFQETALLCIKNASGTLYQKSVSH